MKVSLNWIKLFTPVNIPVDELVLRIGAQLGAVEEVVDFGKRYQGVVVARVVTCEDHPNADRLHVCMIDDGGNAKNVERNAEGLVQVVCGAPNVKAGMLVAWLPPGSTVPDSYDTEPFVLGARELRGVVSNGMLASPRELALGDGHDGILEVDEEVAPGTPFAEVYELNDYIIDIENKMFTHRPDCFGQLGVAREVAGILGQQFVSPEWYMNTEFSDENNDLSLTVRNEATDVVPRFQAIALSNISIRTSPIKVQTYLLRVGIRPINNVVDITNYLMMLTGQPLHAYDYDKVVSIDGNGAATLVARMANKGESLTLLNGKTISPREGAIVIATDTKAIGLAGVMGGADTEVDEHTKNIILECGTFDMYNIRRTSMAHGLFTDAVTRFNKGQSPYQNTAVSVQAITMLKNMADAQVASELFDNNTQQQQEPINVTSEFINARLGLALGVLEIALILKNVEFVVKVENEFLQITPPFWRTDLEIPEDIVEEVGRLYGYDNLPITLPVTTVSPGFRNATLTTNERVRTILAASGANEMLTYSFVHGRLLAQANQDGQEAFKLSNALSPDLQYYRLSITPSLLNTVHANSKAGFSEFAIFELGQVFTTKFVSNVEGGLPLRTDVLAFVYSSKQNNENGAAYYVARRYLDVLCQKMGIQILYEPLNDQLNSKAIVGPFDKNRSAIIRLKGYDGDEILGVIGEYSAYTRKSLKLPTHAAGFELYIDGLEYASRKTKYRPLAKYPSVTQDLTLQVHGAAIFSDLYRHIQEYLSSKLDKSYETTTEAKDIYKPENSEFKNVTFRITVVNQERTLTDQEVATMVNDVAVSAYEAYGASKI